MDERHFPNTGSIWVGIAHLFLFEQEKTMKKSIIGFLPILLLSKAAFATNFVEPDADTSWLGQGVQSSSGALKGKCLTGTVTDFHNETVNLGYRSNKSAMQSIREVSGSVSASVNLGLFGGSASVSMHTRTEENENTASVVFRFKYVGKDITLQDRTLTTIGQSMVGKTPTEIEDTCGDEYIDHMQLGNDLYFVMQMVFASKEEYEKFVTKIKVRVLFWTKTTTITDEFYDYAQSGRYSIKALSPNPLPQTIINAIGYDGRVSCQPNHSAGMEPCVTAGNTIMNYLLDPSGYKAWLGDENNLGISYFTSSNYEKTGHSEFAGVVPKDTSALVALHTALLDELIVQHGYANTLESYTEATASNPPEYDANLLKVHSNIDVLEQAMDECKANPDLTYCQSTVDIAFNGLQEVDF